MLIFILFVVDLEMSTSNSFHLFRPRSGLRSRSWGQQPIRAPPVISRSIQEDVALLEPDRSRPLSVPSLVGAKGKVMTFACCKVQGECVCDL